MRTVSDQDIINLIVEDKIYRANFLISRYYLIILRQAQIINNPEEIDYSAVIPISNFSVYQLKSSHSRPPVKNRICRNNRTEYFASIFYKLFNYEYLVFLNEFTFFDNQ